MLALPSRYLLYRALRALVPSIVGTWTVRASVYEFKGCGFLATSRRLEGLRDAPSEDSLEILHHQQNGTFRN